MIRITTHTGEIIDGLAMGSGRDWVKVNEAGVKITVNRADIKTIEYASGLVQVGV